MKSKARSNINLPVKPLLPTFNVNSELRLPKTTGIDEDNKLEDKFRVLSLPKALYCPGMVPETEVEPTTSICSLVRTAQSEGRVPVQDRSTA